MKREIRSSRKNGGGKGASCRRSKRKNSTKKVPSSKPESKKAEKKFKMVKIRKYMSSLAENRKFEENRELAMYLREVATFELKAINKRVAKRPTQNSNDPEDDDDEIQIVGIKFPKENRRETSGESAEDEDLERNLVDLGKLKFLPDKQNVVLGQTSAEKREFLKTNATLIGYEEPQMFIELEQIVLQRISIDPQVRGYWRREFDGVIDKGIMMTRAKQLFNHLNDVRCDQFRRKNNGREIDAKEKWKGRGVQFVEQFIEFTQNVKYTPPYTRIRLNRNITRNWFDPIPVFTEIDGELRTDVDVPSTLIYEYADRNKARVATSRMLTTFTRRQEKVENLIQCFCCSQEPVVPCWQNPECNCYQMNSKLQSFQNDSNPNGRTNFSTFEPVLLGGPDHFYNTVGFACSNLCSCRGKCTNNVTLLLEKKLFMFEMFRNHADMGFGVRTMTAVPAGTPIMEFVGELLPETALDASDQDYTFKIWSTNEELAEKLPKLDGRWSPNFRNRLTNLLSANWYLNPKRYGNVARTCCHSCEPNVTLVRVFQKGFSPAHVRLLLVTLEDVFPGTEITFDYGAEYLNELKETHGGCMCDRIGCENNKHFEALCKATEPTLQSYYALRHFNEYRRFVDNVQKKIPEL